MQPKVSHRGRALCSDVDCTVEIEIARKYCAGHEYLIHSWLEKSRAALKRYIAKAEKE